MYLNFGWTPSLSWKKSSLNSGPSEVVVSRLAGRVFLVNENPNPSSAAKLSSRCILAKRRAFASFSLAILSKQLEVAYFQHSKLFDNVNAK